MIVLKYFYVCIDHLVYYHFEIFGIGGDLIEVWRRKFSVDNFFGEIKFQLIIHQYISMYFYVLFLCMY